MAKKIFDVDRVLYLYDKYKTLNGVTMRTGYASTTVKRILLENEVEIKRHIPTRWDIKQRFISK